MFKKNKGGFEYFNQFNDNVLEDSISRGLTDSSKMVASYIASGSLVTGVHELGHKLFDMAALSSLYNDYMSRGVSPNNFWNAFLSGSVNIDFANLGLTGNYNSVNINSGVSFKDGFLMPGKSVADLESLRSIFTTVGGPFTQQLLYFGLGLSMYKSKKMRNVYTYGAVLVGELANLGYMFMNGDYSNMANLLGIPLPFIQSFFGLLSIGNLSLATLALGRKSELYNHFSKFADDFNIDKMYKSNFVNHLITQSYVNNFGVVPLKNDIKVLENNYSNFSDLYFNLKMSILGRADSVKSKDFNSVSEYTRDILNYSNNLYNLLDTISSSISHISAKSVNSVGDDNNLDDLLSDFDVEINSFDNSIDVLEYIDNKLKSPHILGLGSNVNSLYPVFNFYNSLRGV